ncbi:glycosyl hydrolase 108 family protein [Pararoseomonas sp. SCSIO 73927]|uniref:glycoside hydrolase family 108 protein n=1 Tax=Pararoseomonas sp. SCSIO 73927 TaxID=3114537 RepID=UPI0030CC1785
MGFVFEREGALVDHPSDPGGITNRGISLRYAKSKGRLLDLDADGDVDAADIRLITPAVAAEIYDADFYLKVRGPELPASIAIAAADAAVNCGPDRAIRWLQAAVGARVDGALGPLTLVSVAAASPRQLLAEFQARRMVHHATLSTFGTFGLGWMRRCSALSILCAAYLPPVPETSP